MAGRAKKDIKKIEDPKNRKTTYANRRAGLFKKAYELSILAASEVLVITRHPSNSKVSHFSHPKRAEDILIRFLINMSDDHDKKVEDGNGQQTRGRIVIRNKDRLIAQLLELKQDDMSRATAEEISIEQGIPGPIRSGDDNQSIQHFKVINPQDFRQHVLDLQRFYNMGTSTPSKQLFRDYDEKLKAMRSYIQERIMLLQQQQQPQVIQTNAVFENMQQLQQIEEYSMHGKQGFILPQQGYNMQLQPEADHNIKFEQQWEPQGHNIQFQQVPLQHQWSSPYLNTEGSLQAPLQTTPVTQQQEEKINSIDNGHINAIGDQYFNEIELATLMSSSPNNRWCSTYDTDGPSRYIHQSFGGSSQQGSKFVRKEATISPSCVISIDDDDDDDRSGTDSHAKTSGCRYGRPRNRYGLDFTSETESFATGTISGSKDSSGVGFSEGEGFDCEILDDSSGSIRQEWERAHSRKTTPPDRVETTHCENVEHHSNMPDFGPYNDEINFDEHYFEDLNFDELNFDDLNFDELNFD